jgi:hypothetical protein
MPCRKRATPAAGKGAAADPGRDKKNKPVLPPVVIDSRGVYQPAWIQQALGLPRSTLRREIRLGRLAVVKRSGRYFILGRQLLDWLEAGEVTRRPRNNVTADDAAAAADRRPADADDGDGRGPGGHPEKEG